MSTETREFSWMQVIHQLDDEHTRDSNVNVEYEFSTPYHQRYEHRTHEQGRRVFKGHYKQRGPYASDDE